MAIDETGKKIAAACVECNTVYAARMTVDGVIHLIGTSTCECGSTEFIDLTGERDPDGKLHPSQ